jgi:phospholipid N-methyltransferase
MPSANWTFFQAFLKSPTTVASMIPSSRFLERRVVRAARLEHADTVVELGAGTVGTTRALLSALRPEARLVAIERTAELARALCELTDPRLAVVEGCASSIVGQVGQRQADAVISGIPFSTLPSHLADVIIREVRQALRPGGRFVAYQFSDRVADYARPIFGAPVIEHELCNFPPLRVYTWQTPATETG